MDRVVNASGSDRKSYRSFAGVKHRRVQLTVPEEIMKDIDLLRSQLNLSDIASKAFANELAILRGEGDPCPKCAKLKEELREYVIQAGKVLLQFGTLSDEF